MAEIGCSRHGSGQHHLKLGNGILVVCKALCVGVCTLLGLTGCLLESSLKLLDSGVPTGRFLGVGSRSGSAVGLRIIGNSSGLRPPHELAKALAMTVNGHDQSAYKFARKQPQVAGFWCSCWPLPWYWQQISICCWTAQHGRQLRAVC